MSDSNHCHFNCWPYICIRHTTRIWMLYNLVCSGLLCSNPLSLSDCQYRPISHCNTAKKTFTPSDFKKFLIQSPQPYVSSTSFTLSLEKRWDHFIWSTTPYRLNTIFGKFSPHDFDSKEYIKCFRMDRISEHYLWRLVSILTGEVIGLMCYYDRNQH